MYVLLIWPVENGLVNLSFRSFDKNLLTILITGVLSGWFRDVVLPLYRVQSKIYKYGKGRCKRSLRRCRNIGFLKDKSGWTASATEA